MVSRTSASFNPYAPPGSAVDGPTSGDGCWREGKKVHLLKTAALPARCLHCNQAVEKPAKNRTLYWHHPALYLLILLNILIYAVVALFVRKKVKLAPALCRQHVKRRRWLQFATVLSLVASVLCVLMSVNETGVTAPWFGLTGAALFFGALIAAVRLTLIRLTRVTDEVISFTGGKAPFLDSLPERAPRAVF